MSDAGGGSESSSSGGNDGPAESTGQNTTSNVVWKYRDKKVKDVAIELIKQEMNDIKIRLSVDVEKNTSLDIDVDGLFTEGKQFNLKNHELMQLFNDKTSGKNNDGHRKRVNRDGKLPDKVFMPRNSLLTDLFEVKHIKTAYHIFIAILFVLALKTLVHDFVDTGRINLGFRPIIAGFGKFHIALMLWSCMQTSTFLLYPCFLLWASTRKSFKSGSYMQKLWDWTSLVLFVSYQCGFVLAAIKAHLWFDLALASGVAHLLEMTRFLMKAHAFIRSNVPRALFSDKKHADSKPSSPDTYHGLPSFSKYAYFLFAPTLVYRDEYPRTKQIRWRVVARHAVDVIGLVFYVSFMVECWSPPFEKFGQAKISSGSFVGSLFVCIIPGILSLLCLFYCFVHSWLNGAAELLRFADRMFYRDWWNEFTFPGFIRSWNVVIHDWLYTYVYKDCVEHVFCHSRPLAMMAVFTVSSVFHELILTITLRFFYPVMFVQYELFGLLMFVTKRLGSNVGNVLIWFLLMISFGVILNLYSIEYYARRNCPDIGDSIVDYMVPVSWTCNGISHNPNWTITAPWSLP